MRTDTPKRGVLSATSPRICFIYKEDYPWDVRVEKILRTLTAAGHEVSLICRNTKRLPTRERRDGFEIYRLPVIPGFGGKLNSLLSLPFYFNPFWLFWMWRYARTARPQILVVRDLPLMPTGILVGKMIGPKVIFDMAECYPEMYASTLKFSDAKLGKFLLKNPSFARLMEKISTRLADHVLVMIEESRDRLIRLGTDPGKITIVSNTPVSKGTEKGRLHQADGILRLLYVGFITRIRGLDNILRGIRAFLDQCDGEVNLEFNVVGIGSALDRNQELCRELDLESVVTFHGWCDQEIVDGLYARSDIGVLTYHVCSHWNHTIPNKVFDYMQAGMPVLATDVIPIKRILERIGCGLVFQDNDPKGCADCLAKLQDAELRNQMAQNGVEAVKREFNWDKDTEKLHQVVNSLVRIEPL